MSARGGPMVRPGGQGQKASGESEDNPLRKAAEWLRGRGGPEVRSSVLMDERVDLFRSKDLLRCLVPTTPPASTDKQAPALAAFLTQSDPARRRDEVIKLGALMLRANYIFRVDRVVKERSKGRKHVKFPTKVEPHPVQEFLPDSFYVWRGVDAPKSLWTTLGPALLVFIVLAVTLFPVAPYKVKLGVVYTAMGMLCLLFIVSVLRVILFALIWVGTGRYVWLLPNLYADDIPITRILTPLIEETPRGPPASTAASSKKPDAASSSSDAAAAAGSQLVPTQEEAEGPSLASRLQVAFALVLACYAMYSALPEGTGVVSTAVGTSNSILEMLNLHEAGAKRLSEGGVGGGDGDANSSSLANLHPTLGLGPQAPPMTAAEAAAAAALKGGKVGPAGVKPVDAGLTAEQLSNLAPIPEEEDEDGATAGQPVADGVGAGQDSADLIRAEATAPDAEVHQPKEDL